MTSAAKLPIEPAKKVNKHHLDRLKREEEEEQWISGEELYTEGSSDEDDKGVGKRIRKREHRGARPKAHKTKSEIPLAVPRAPEIQTGDRDSDSADEPPPDISWKPKRGSIRLPNIVGETQDNVNLKTTEALKE